MNLMSFFLFLDSSMPLHHVIDYVAAHPVVLLLLVIVLAAIIFSIVKKFLKFAFIAIIAFVTINALMIYFADKDWAKKGKQLIEETAKKAGEVVTKEGKKLIDRGLDAKRDTLPPPTQKKKR